MSDKVLNAGQQLAADGFFAFLLGTEKELRISGPAGNGKTFLMGHMIDEIMPRYYKTCELMGIEPGFDEVVMTATTNKAADVLSDNTGRPASTIHSFMNLKVVDDYSTGTSKITRTRSWKVHENKIIFIDEAYTMDSPVYRYIQEGTHNCKVIYVGDHCQLPPVMEAQSPITTLQSPFFELTEPMRNAAQPALRTICNQLRNTVETGIFNNIQIVPGVIDYLDNDQMEHHMHNEFINRGTDRILAYTNNRVLDYNDFIRAARQLPATYTQGETLINNSAFQIKDRMLSVEEEVTLHSLDPVSKTLQIAQDAEIEVRGCVLKTKFGTLVENIHIPVDREHFARMVSYFSKQKNWERYFYLKNNFPDLRARDASTVHKSQGSTYDTVYIDLWDLSACRSSLLAARLLYVAFSRASNHIYLYGNLAKKYGEIVL